MTIKVEDLTVAYKEKPVLLDIDLEFTKAKLTAIVGPNGAGKSTLIKTMLDLVKPLTGSILFSGKPYKEVQKEIAYVPQRNSVDWDFPINALDVVCMGRYGKIGWFKRVRKEDKEKSLQAIKSVGMTGFEDRQISQLSGGQQQRIFLARALTQEAEIYFLDEPFQGVDTKTEKAIITILKELTNNGKTVIVVHHDLQTITDYFDEVALINLDVIASGKIHDTFTKENIEKTYKQRHFIDVLKEKHI